MAGELPAPGTLEKWMLDVERQLRDLATGNPLNQGAVQKASGEYVPLSSLAFGMVTWTWTEAQLDNGNDGLAIRGVVNAAGGSGWLASPPPGINPVLDVLVTGGHLRVDLSASMIVIGRLATASMSYRLTGPATTQAGLGAGGLPVLVNGDSVRAISINAPNINGGQGGGSFSNFALEEDLAQGWYRVEARFSLVWAADPSVQPIASIGIPRLMLTPY
jgi:hypothetical protein